MKKLIAIVLASAFMVSVVAPIFIGDDENSYKSIMGRVYEETIKARTQTP